MSRFDGYGSGLISPDGKTFYVNIPKNASSYLSDTLSRQGWVSAKYGDDQIDYSRVETSLVVMRDPIDRWISGVSQFLVTRILNFIGPQTYIDTEPDSTYWQGSTYVEDYPLSAAAFVLSYSGLIERFLFNQADQLDDHVWPQHYFFEHILSDIPRKIIVINDNFENALKSMGIITFNDADRNQSSDHEDKVILKDFFRRRIENNPERAKLLWRIYNKDYEIIKNAI